MPGRFYARAFPFLAAALLLGGCATVGLSPRGAQHDPRRDPAPVDHTPVDRTRRYVVVDVDRNELRFMDGDQVLWKAPVGTGTGFRLADREESGRKWEFTTPSGTMHVVFKELNPTWFIPDWWFIENKRPIPPEGSPERKEEGGLGAAAVYLGNEIAIHGTDKPELLGRRVSHGCIRLSNENALRLYHDVQVGTPVVIVGKQEVVHEEQPDSVASFTQPAKKKPAPPANPLAKLSTARLLERLDRQLSADDTTAHWTLTAGELIERGLKDDATALRGVLARAGMAEPEKRRKEYEAFVADAFSRGALRAVVSLNRISAAARDRAAEAIVAATMELYHGALDDPTAPWPTRRVPKGRLGPEGQAGWTALQKAEAEYRADHGALARGSR